MLLTPANLIHSSLVMLQKHATRSSRRDAISFIVKAAQEPSASLASQGLFFFHLGLLKLNSQLPLSYNKLYVICVIRVACIGWL